MNKQLMLKIRSSTAELIAKGLAKSSNVTNMARKVVRVYDNDCNADMKKNGEFLLLRFIVSRRNRGVFFDVGANVGDWSSEALALGFKGKLYAVDPLPRNIKHLRGRFSKATSFSALQYALSDSAGKTEFFSNVDDSQSGTDSLYNMKNIGYLPELSVVEVDCITLDSLVKTVSVDKIDFLKIDVEGHELSVLQGAKSLLSKGKIDFIQLEFGHAARAARVYLHDIVEYAGEYAYNIYVIKPKGFMPLQFNPFVENRYSYINFLLVKPSVVHDIEDYILPE